MRTHKWTENSALCDDGGGGNSVERYGDGSDAGMCDERDLSSVCEDEFSELVDDDDGDDDDEDDDDGVCCCACVGAAFLDVQFACVLVV